MPKQKTKAQLEGIAKAKATRERNKKTKQNDIDRANKEQLEIDKDLEE
jgi:hypothetical protein